MFRWLQAFVRRELVSDVPPEMDLCLDCGRILCSEEEFRNCARRKERAAKLAVGPYAPEAAEEGRTEEGADLCEAGAKGADERSAENERRPSG